MYIKNIATALFHSYKISKCTDTDYASLILIEIRIELRTKNSDKFFLHYKYNISLKKSLK